MKKIAVVHFLPLEYYPPTINILDALGNIRKLRIKVWSTNNIKNRSPYTNPNLVNIRRTVFPRPADNRFLRLFYYLWFNLKVFLELIFFNPDKILYFESYSAGPVYWYFKFFGKKKDLFVHYHEYFDQNWYDQGMVLVKKYYNYEKNFLLKKAEWISQTNQFRIDLFRKDHPYLESSQLHVMANFPPESWGSTSENKNKNSNLEKPLQIVYIGSLSLEDTFIEDFCIWVDSMNGAVNFDIFSFNCSDSTIDFFSKMNSKSINFFREGIAYQKIPSLLDNYHVGVILYKGTTPNAKYCASNKLFEYLSCGLEVWVSMEQEGTKPYLNIGSRPVVKSLDFTKLNESLISDYYKSSFLPKRTISYYCEAELQELISRLKA